MKKKRPARGNAERRESGPDVDKPGPIVFSFDGRDIEVVFDLPEESRQDVADSSNPPATTEIDPERSHPAPS